MATTYLVPGDLDAALRRLEAVVLKYQPRCTFDFGGLEEENRPKSAPFVLWSVLEAEAADGTMPDRVPKGTYQMVDDWVVIKARCVGPVASGLVGPALRRQQMAASYQVFLAVSLAAHGQHQGYLRDRGWRPIYPADPADAYVPTDYSFSIRAPRLTPPLGQVQPTEAPATLEIT
jgi:hypothetical protein